MSAHLGINKDLEPLVREVRRAGGTVTVAKSNHVRWVMPYTGEVVRTGLTMSSGTARDAERRVRKALNRALAAGGWVPAA